ncbi:WAP four-disulfide core domain protein 12-like [Pelodiscus sinensis]|uniref:WAP four-disulfide core domain protein 12-like n=1 Tax=Pelodiscus sinensis TaxID=13735 RepID=UPI003F6D7533
MQSVGVLLFVRLLTFQTELPAACGQKSVKLGTCPPDYNKCRVPEMDECDFDFDCGDYEKCCFCNCAMRCVKPAEEAPGICPDITEICSMIDPPNVCKKDNTCPENQKCCDTGCGKDCVWPKNSTYLS